MTQQNVIKLMKKDKNRWFSSREIAKKLKISNNSVHNNLKGLTKGGEVILKTKEMQIKKRYNPHLWKIP